MIRDTKMEDREYCIRMDVCRKRSLYTRCLIFGFMSIFSMLIWLITGFGMFWPIWVMAGFILTIFVEALQICSLGCFRRWFSFLTPEWEKCEVDRCMNYNCYSNNTPCCPTTCQTTPPFTTIPAAPTIPVNAAPTPITTQGQTVSA